LGHNFLLKKAMGRSIWDKIAPTAIVEASVVMSNGSEKFGSDRETNETMADFKALKAASLSGDH